MEDEMLRRWEALEFGIGNAEFGIRKAEVGMRNSEGKHGFSTEAHGRTRRTGSKLKGDRIEEKG